MAGRCHLLLSSVGACNHNIATKTDSLSQNSPVIRHENHGTSGPESIVCIQVYNMSVEHSASLAD